MRKYPFIKAIIGAFLLGFGGKLVGISQLSLEMQILNHPINVIDGYFAILGGAILLIEGLLRMGILTNEDFKNYDEKIIK